MPSLQTQKLSPDTCGCVWEESWMRYFCSDCSQYFNSATNWCNYHNRATIARNNCEFNSDEPKPRVHSWYQTHVKCAEHSGLTGQAAYTHGRSQMQTKNWSFGEILEELASSNYDELRENFLDTSLYPLGWYFSGTDDTRILHIVTKNLNAGQINAVQVRVDNRVGSGKVVIE